MSHSTRTPHDIKLKDRYIVGERIGSGGMGSIFRGVDSHMKRNVAIKFLHPHLIENTAVRKRFIREAKITAHLVDAHVVGVYDQGSTPSPWIVLELIEGPSLRNVLSVLGFLPQNYARSIIRPLAVALQKAHSIGLIHRDIKPENVLFTNEGIPKLADFGIAELLSTRENNEKEIVGSVHYLAPEIIYGEPASPLTDQYALGVMLFELLTGRKPLPAETVEEIATRHATEALPKPSDFAPNINSALEKVIAKATSLDRGDRFEDMSAFVKALGEAVPGLDNGLPLGQMRSINQTLLISRDQLPLLQRKENRRTIADTVLRVLGAITIAILVSLGAWQIYIGVFNVS